MAGRLSLFIATYSLPGFLDTVEIWSEDQSAAQIRAEEIGREPWADWPSIRMRGSMEITVHPATAAHALAADSVRRQGERAAAGSSIALVCLETLARCDAEPHIARTAQTLLDEMGIGRGLS